MMADTLPAKIDGFPLVIETIEDSIEKSIAKYEFPFRSGALLEDMGQKARVVKIKCHFYGDDYGRHTEFLKHLEKKDFFEFTHPKYGLLKGCVEAVSVRHDDRIEAAEVDITFAESLPAPEPRHAPNIASAVEKPYTDGQWELIDEVAFDIRAGFGTEADELRNRALDLLQSIREQFQDAVGNIRDYVAQVDECVRAFEAALSSISNPANSLIATIDYPTTLPGRIIGALAKTMERYSILYGSARTAPARYVESFLSGTDQLDSSLPAASKSTAGQAAVAAMRKYIRIAAAQRLSLDLAYIYKEDETKRQKQKRLERTKSFDLSGNYLRPEPSGRIMTIDAIEKTLAAARTEIQASVDSARSMPSLKELAKQLLFHVNTIKLEREKIRKTEVDTVMPLHLVCLRNGLPYNYAARIHAINAIRNPSFTSGEVNIYAG